MEAYGDLLEEPFARAAGDGVPEPAAAAANPNPPPGQRVAPDLAVENMQARIRGNLVMALSNRFGWLVLTTGNKSELSVGYATLYGDMAGGFAVIKDCFKTLVYRLVRYRCGVEERELIPDSVLERPPSAELRPDQRDEDSLPPYELLDRILEAYVERDQGRDDIVGAGLPEDVVDEVLAHGRPRRVQAPPGAAGDQDHPEGVRPRPPAADHQPVRRLSSPQRASRSATTTWASAHRRPSSSVISTCHTHEVRPRWRTFAAALTWPSEIGRRNVALFDWPTASLPSGVTASLVALEHIASASTG